MLNLTKEYCNSIFEYRKDGVLIRKTNQCSVARKGEIAGSYSKSSKRMVVNIGKTPISISRIIFLMHHGYLPETVDHIDRNGLNDRIENLRAATVLQNSRNRTKMPNRTSQYLGVHKCTRPKQWKVSIKAEGKHIFGGRYSTEEEAALVYNGLAIKYFGEFASLNIIKPKI